MYHYKYMSCYSKYVVYKDSTIILFRKSEDDAKFEVQRLQGY